MAKDELIRESHGKVKRNIHLIIGFFFAAAVGAVFFYEETKDASQKKQELAQAAKPKVDVKSAPEQKTLQTALTKQKESVKPEFPGQVPGLGQPGVPGLASEGLRDKDGAAVTKAQEDRSIEEAKRQTQLAGSGIMAFNGDILPPPNNDDLAASNPPPLSQILADADARNRTPDVNLGTPSSALQPRDSTPQTKADQDKAWLDQQATPKKKQIVLEDTENSPFTLFQGTYIPSVMVSPLNSQLPGNITAMVTRDVYDGVTGKNLIIPRGSKLFGVYNNNIGNGQNRIIAAFTRIVMPGGRSVTLPGMPSTDAAGASGIPGEANNHYFQKFGVGVMAAVLATVIDRQNQGGNTTVINTGSGSGTPTSAAGTIIVDIARQNQQRVNAIPVEILVKQGEPFNIIVNQDIAINPVN